MNTLNDHVLSLCTLIRAANLESVDVTVRGDGRVVLYAIDHRGFTRAQALGDALPGGPLDSPADMMRKFAVALTNPLTHGQKEDA